ncbi:MAG: restriction endonuclease subunit S [Verrucomicrobiota bacterium]
MKDPNENRPGYRETKVGCIPEEWPVKYVRDFGNVVTGNTPNKGDQRNYGNHTPWCTAVDMTDKYVRKTAVCLSEAGRKQARILPRGSVLVTCIASIGKNGIAAIDLATNQQINTLMPAPSASGEYFYYAICASKKRMLRHAGQTAVPILNKSEFEALPLPFPPLHEQKKIAEILSTWDEAIEQTRKLIDAKKRRKKGLMQQLLTGKRRLPGFSGKWKTHKLDTLFKERCETGREDLPLLAITGSRGVIPAEEIERKDSSSTDKSRYKRIAGGDIGYNTMRMWQGVNALSSLEGIVSPAYTICIPSDQLCGRFLSYYFKFQPVVHWFYRYSQGLVSDTWNLKFHHFAQISLAFPEKDEQEAIASVLRAADDEITWHEAELNALEKQKRGLMQKLLTGTVRVVF